jgi:hypothetical protein
MKENMLGCFSSYLLTLEANLLIMELLQI